MPEFTDTRPDAPEVPTAIKPVNNGARRRNPIASNMRGNPEQRSMGPYVVENSAAAQNDIRERTIDENDPRERKEKYSTAVGGGAEMGKPNRNSHHRSGGRRNFGGGERMVVERTAGGEQHACCGREKCCRCFFWKFLRKLWPFGKKVEEPQQTHGRRPNYGRGGGRRGRTGNGGYR